MATIYCRSTDGDDGDDGSTWALAKATLQAAMTAAGAGGRVYVSNNHAETFGATLTLTSPGTASSPLEILCGDDAAEPPTALATTATMTASGSLVDIVFEGYAYYYGITFEGGTTGGSIKFGNASPSNFWHRMEQCGLKPKGSPYIVSTTYGYSINGAVLELIDSTITFSSTGSYVRLFGGEVKWKGGSIAGTAPTTLFKGAGAYPAIVSLEGVDLSLLGSGKNIIDISTVDPSRLKLVDCKLGSSVVIATGTSTLYGGMEVEAVNCDSADTNYRYYKKNYCGEVLQETTIVRSGGASDGATPISRKMVSTAGCEYHFPLVLHDLVTWNETIGSSLTATVEIVNDGVTLQDDEIWLEVEYLGTSGFPIGSFVDDRKANILASAANQPTSSETWTTTGLGSPVKQYLSAAFTPQEKGPVRVRVMLAKPSQTVYVCPKVSIA